MHLVKLSTLLLVLFIWSGCKDDGGSGDGGSGAVLPTLIVDQEAISVTETDYEWAIVTIPLSLEGELVGSTSVQVSTQDETAESGKDYKSLSNRVFFGSDGTANVSVRVYGDLHLEEAETFAVNFTNGTNVIVGEDQQVTVTIENNDDTVNPFSIPPTGVDIGTEYPGYSLFWADEFDDPATLDQNYVHDLGSLYNGWGNNELEYYQEDNVIIGDGHLIIEAREESRAGFDYTSTRIKTKDILEFTYGRIDVRAAMPEGQGVWPAIWMLGANIDEVSWPRCGEIDIMEMLGHERNTLHGTAHFADASGNYMSRSNSVQVPQGLNRTFNVFSVVWTETYLEWRLNDVPYHRMEKSQIGTGWVFDRPQFFLFNVAVGGNWPGSPDATTQFPQRMFIDYVRVYQED